MTQAVGMTNASWIRHITGFAVVTMLSFFVAFLIAHALAKPGEFILRTTGGLLQLFGVLSVALGIQKLRRSFGLKPMSEEILRELWASVVQHARRIARIFRRRGRIVGAMAATLGEVKLTGSLSTRLILGRSQDLPVQERLQSLERAFDYMQDVVQNVQYNVQKKIDLTTEALATERVDREKHVAEIRSNIRLAGKKNVLVQTKLYRRLHQVSAFVECARNKSRFRFLRMVAVSKGKSQV